MADITSSLPGGGDGPDAERAQLVLVTALIIGVALIALVLLVNAAIYTENLATRDPDVGDEEVLAYEATVVEGVGGVVDRENANEYDTYDNVQSNVSAGLDVLNGHLERTKLENGIVASMNLSAASYSEGRLILHTNSSRNFTAADETANWTLAENVSDARQYVTNVNRADLVTSTASNVSSDGVFHVVLDDESGNEWHAYIYEEDSNVTVAVKPGGSSDAVEACTVAATNATVNFTAGTIDGKDCPGLDWADGTTGEYTVRYENGDEATGTYAITVNSTDSGTRLNDDASLGSPYLVPAVYSIRLEFTYRSPDLEYRTTVRVARGEPDA